MLTAWLPNEFSSTCRNEEYAIGAFAKVCSSAVQAAVLHERMRRPPAITKFITSSLTRQAALELCIDRASAICKAQAIRLVFPAGGKVCCVQASFQLVNCTN